MDLLYCKYCNSNLVNLIGIKVIHDSQSERNINIKNQYSTMKDMHSIHHDFCCYNCGKVSEMILKNKRGCCFIEHSKKKDGIISPRNEVLVSKNIF